ncbi:MAG: DUF4160 domain-containing protein [Azonexus sp.]|nr:DUF4160 domain-containing protein [Azonexus sp.]
MANLSKGSDHNSSYTFSNSMPTISRFFSILIQTLIHAEHDLPHFYSLYVELKALIDIPTLETVEGRMPLWEMRMVLKWASEHRAELLDWPYHAVR